ncbi:hypothetical protein FWH13_03040 [Candidatus Saccharibacteria bacterium]|nr:hypothetical protein [Candidatus Saccharibacteria bacterium]
MTKKAKTIGEILDEVLEYAATNPHGMAKSIARERLSSLVKEIIGEEAEATKGDDSTVYRHVDGENWRREMALERARKLGFDV